MSVRFEFYMAKSSENVRTYLVRSISNENLSFKSKAEFPPLEIRGISDHTFLPCAQVGRISNLKPSRHTTEPKLAGSIQLLSDAYDREQLPRPS